MCWVRGVVLFGAVIARGCWSVRGFASFWVGSEVQLFDSRLVLHDQVLELGLVLDVGVVELQQLLALDFHSIINARLITQERALVRHQKPA